MKKSMRPHLEKCDLALLKENSYIFLLIFTNILWIRCPVGLPIKMFLNPPMGLSQICCVTQPARQQKRDPTLVLVEKHTQLSPTRTFY